MEFIDSLKLVSRLLVKKKETVITTLTVSKSVRDQTGSYQHESKGIAQIPRSEEWIKKEMAVTIRELQTWRCVVVWGNKVRVYFSEGFHLGTLWPTDGSIRPWLVWPQRISSDSGWFLAKREGRRILNKISKWFVSPDTSILIHPEKIIQIFWLNFLIYKRIRLKITSPNIISYYSHSSCLKFLQNCSCIFLS